MMQAMGPRSQPSWQPAPKVSTSLCTAEGEGGRKEVEGEINDSNTHTCYIVNTCGFKHVPTHTCIHTYTHVRTHAHTHTHTHTHTQSCLLKWVGSGGGVWSHTLGNVLVPVDGGVVNGADAARVVRGREVLPAEVGDGEGRRHHRRNGGLGGEGEGEGGMKKE